MRVKLRVLEATIANDGGPNYYKVRVSATDEEGIITAHTLRLPYQLGVPTPRSIRSAFEQEIDQTKAKARKQAQLQDLVGKEF